MWVLKKKFLVPLLVVLLVVYAGLTSLVWWAMHQPPEKFGHVMASMPEATFLVLPFETMWTRARAGSLHTGDAAPDFSLLKLDKSDRIQLSALTVRQPVVLVFGSYT